MKRIFLLTVALALITLGRRDIWATNDRYVVAQFTNGTSTVSGGIQTTLSLQVFNDIANLQYPSHFIQRVDITVPSGFTGSGANGGFVASDFIPPTGWRVYAITGNVISLIDGTASQIYGPGISRTFLLKLKTPIASCPGTPYPFGVVAYQTTSGGGGNLYKYRPTRALPTVTVSNCITPTYLELNSVNPPAILATGDSQTVTLTATLSTLKLDSLGNPGPGTPIAGETLTFSEGSAPITCNASTITNALGTTTCTYTPLTGPVTPLVAGNYDESASYAGNSTPFPPLGAANSNSKQLTVSTTATSLTVPDASGPFGGTVTLSATLASGAAQIGVQGQSITFSLNGTAVGTASTNASGVATLSNVSLAGIAGGSYPDYVGASFGGSGTYSAVSNNAKLTVTEVGQTITFIGPADQPLINASVGISASDSASLQVTFTSNTPLVCSIGSPTFVGSTTSATVSFLGLGQCSITASQPGNNSYTAAPTVTRTFNIVNTAMTCTLGNLSVFYNGASQSPTCSTNVPNVSCTVSIVPQTNVGTYPVGANPPAGYSCTANGTFEIKKVNQDALTVNAGTPLIFNHSETLTTSGGSSGGAVTYTLVSGPCTLNGAQLTANSGIGTCVVNATMAGGSNYNDVTSANANVTLAKADQGALATVAGSPLTFNQSEPLSTTGGSSGGAVTYHVASGACLLSGSQLTANSGTGSCAVNATMAGNDNYKDVTSPDATVTLAKADQDALVLVAGSPLVYGHSETLGTTGGNAGAVTYDLVPGSCSLSGAQLTANSGTGSCSATATRAGDNNYKPVTSAAGTVTLTKELAAVNLSNMTVTYTGQPQQPTATTLPGLVLVYSGDALPQTDSGSYNVSWTISDANYYGSGSGPFKINGSSQTITIQSFIVAATSTSGLPVTFSSGNTLCTVEATAPAINDKGQYTALVTLVSPNTDWTKCKVLEDQTGSPNYNAAPQATAILGDPLQ